MICGVLCFSELSTQEEMFFSFFNKKCYIFRNSNKYLLGTAFENIV